MKDPNDYHTRTIEGAAAHARRFTQPVELDYDEEEEEEEEEEYDLCGCSDPGCPCDGPPTGKRGGSI